VTAASPRAAIGVVAGLLGVFVARPFLVGLWPLIALFTVLLIIGIAWPVERERSTRVLLCLLAGLGAFTLGRLIGGGHAPAPPTLRVIAASTLAAVAEEAFFRRLLWAVLRPGGVVLAALGSAGLFAVAHVTVYGWWVLPLDLAAGLVLAWQRWASGSWAVPAVTHVVANLLVVV
jgi:membrane protease YdiL (CAAX protease family)